MASEAVGRIVKIFHDSLMLANIGLDHGVRFDDELALFEWGEEIVEPETGESLGRLEVVKARLRAAHVQPTMTLLVPQATEGSGYASSTKPQVLSAVLAQTYTGGAAPARTGLTVRRDQVTGMPRPAPVQLGDRVRPVLKR